MTEVPTEADVVGVVVDDPGQGGKPEGDPDEPVGYSSHPMSKKTTKRKLKARKSKANHGKKPNTGR